MAFLTQWTEIDYLLIYCCIELKSQGRVGSIVVSCGLDHLGFESNQEQEIFLFYKLLRSTSEPTQPPFQGVLEFLPRDKMAGV